ncbi:MAG: hypothetical protein HKUEN01_05480 [Candidatus Kuenenia stuttgartiensis]|nr:MAG: hypothetical protein HKUEN01_05480 [Candidatus Kuenenia stuttgartiensis]
MIKDITWLIVSKKVLKEPKTGGQIYSSNVFSYLHEKNINIHIKTLEDIKTNNYFIANFFFIKNLIIKKQLQKIVYEDFYMHPWLFIFNWILRFFTRKRIIIFVQLFYHDIQKNKILNLIDKIISSVFLRSAHVVIANSQTVANECMKLGVKQKIEIVYPGCDFANEIVPQKSNSLSDVKILAISNYIPRKGFHYLISAIALIKTKYPDCYEKLSVQIAGDPNDRPDYTTSLKVLICNNNLEDKVKLLGWKSRNEIRELFLSSEIFVFTGIHEGYGMVLAEAMHYGLPIVAYKSGAVPELVENMHNGLLVAPKDLEGLALAIVRLVNDSKLRISMGQNSKNRSARFVHSWDAVGLAFYKIITESREITA